MGWVPGLLHRPCRLNSASQGHHPGCSAASRCWLICEASWCRFRPCWIGRELHWQRIWATLNPSSLLPMEADPACCPPVQVRSNPLLVHVREAWMWRQHGRRTAGSLGSLTVQVEDPGLHQLAFQVVSRPQPPVQLTGPYKTPAAPARLSHTHPPPRNDAPPSPLADHDLLPCPVLGRQSWSPAPAA